MANRLRGEVEIVLDGEPRTLRFSMGVLAEIEQRFDGRAVDSLFFGVTPSRVAILTAVQLAMASKTKKYSFKNIAMLMDRTVDDDPDALAIITAAVIRGILAANGATAARLSAYDEMVADVIQDASETDGDEEEPSARPTSSAAVRGGDCSPTPLRSE